MYKSAGSPVSALEVINKTNLAQQKVLELNGIISKALEADLARRAKVNRASEANAENDREG